MLTASLTSVSTVSLLLEELVASLASAITYLGSIENPSLAVSPSSAYSLSTAVT